MNILLINKFYFLKGGAEHQFFALKKLLEDKDHAVVPFAMQHKKNISSLYDRHFVSYVPTENIPDVWQLLRTIGRFWWSFEAQRKIKKLLKEKSIDIVHLHNIYHQISPSILSIIKKRGLPIVMTVHDYSLISPNYNLYLNGKVYDKICGKSYYKCLFNRCVDNSFMKSLICTIEMYLHHKILKVYKKNIDLFIAPSQFVKDKLVQAGFNQGKIKIIPHFVETQKQFNPSTSLRTSNEAMKQFNNKDYILYFGRLSEEKGISTLIQAMKKLPDVKLKIVGGGPLKNKCQSLIVDYKLQHNIEMFGQRDGDELKNLIINSQFVIVPSLSPETFGLSALEAMALGKCVLASQIGALPELVDKDCLFKPSNVAELAKKIQTLTKDENYVKVKGNQNKKKAQKYGEKQYYKQILQVYKKLKANQK